MEWFRLADVTRTAAPISNHELNPSRSFASLSSHLLFHTDFGLSLLWRILSEAVLDYGATMPSSMPSLCKGWESIIQRGWRK